MQLIYGSFYLFIVRKIRYIVVECPLLQVFFVSLSVSVALFKLKAFVCL